MRTLFYLISIGILVGFAGWAYKINYDTRAATRYVNDLKKEIAAEAEKIEMARAEWAYLNRPERLMRLADANFDVLRLGPVAFDQTMKVQHVAFPRLEPNLARSPADATADAIEAITAISSQGAQ